MNTPPPPPIPRRSSRRKSGTSSPAPSNRQRPWLDNSSRWSQDTSKTAPPAYDWAPPASLGGDDKGNPPVEGEKLAELRKSEGWRKPPSRGGWGRLWILIGVAVVVVLALAIGLGVGLSKKKSSSSSDDTSSGSSSTPQDFPLGEYSFVTALMQTTTYCTSNPATWRCYPFTNFNPSSGGSDTSSQAYFNWAITNTEDNYATVDSVSSTPDSGIPANLTISSKNDPFGIVFGAKPLTYHASSSNSSSPRYTFSFTLPKKVIPSSAITSDGSQAECFFNQTIFTGNIYLSASRNYPSDSSKDSTSIGGYTQWPHAVEVTQMASGGTNVPNCYETGTGAPITDAGLTPQAGNFECSCDYRNYY